MSLFLEKSIFEINSEIRSKKLGVADLFDEVIDKSEQYERFKFWNDFSSDLLRANCNRLTNNMEAVLHGIPFAVKDNMNTYDYTTEMGSILWKGFCAGNNARVVDQIVQNGGCVAGKSVTAEFAVHTLNETQNPYDITKTPGTSSSGSAVAVALGVVPFALATQTAGSIIRPSSFCGVFGFKPSFGLVSRVGVLKTTDSLDTMGFITSNERNIKPIFDSIVLKELDYPFAYRYLNDMSRQRKGNRPWKLILIKTCTWNEADNYVRNKLIEWIDGLDTQKYHVDVKEDLEVLHGIHDYHQTIYDKSLSYYFENEHLNREMVSKTMNSMMDHGDEVTTEEYLSALKKQEEQILAFDSFMEEYDAIVSISTGSSAVNRDDIEIPDPSLIWTYLHLPTVNIPAFSDEEGMPFGLQIAARKYNDYLMMELLDDLINDGFIPEKTSDVKYKDIE